MPWHTARVSENLEQKIDPVSHDIAAIAENLKSGNRQATDLEHAPMIMAYALIHWIFDYPSQSNGYGFPFDRTHLDFYRRIQDVHLLLKQIRDADLGNFSKANRPFYQLDKVITKVVEDKRLSNLAKNLESKAIIFDKLRYAMRIALPEGKKASMIMVIS